MSAKRVMPARGRRRAWLLPAILCGVVAIGVAQTTPRKPAAQTPAEKPADRGANPEAVVLADFKQRIDAYIKLREGVEKGAAEQKETSDPAKIHQAKTSLAARIRTARKDAKPGAIFTPEIRAEFRRLMYPETKGAEGRDTKAAIKEDAPAAAVPLKVNAAYPEGAALPTVPPNLLANLPQLPEQLEYRVVEKHMILRDVDANLIIDFIPNAIR